MNSIERLKRYNELTQEAASTTPADPPVDAWPLEGGISFKDVQLRYRPELPLVLKGVTFDVRPGEKVGIIGRTGAGKSSLVQAIYRTVELAAGEVRVDGADLRALGLNTVRLSCLANGEGTEKANQQLRSRMAIIPQESFLFGGTVR